MPRTKILRAFAAATFAAACVSAALAGGTSPPQGTSATALQGRPISTTAPTTSQVLTWTGSAWAPAASSGGGASSLQAAYDGGRTIATGGAGSVSFSAPSTATTPVLDLSQGAVGGLALQALGGVSIAQNDTTTTATLSLNRVPGSASAGSNLSVYSGPNSTDQGIYLAHDGTGSALVVNQFGGGQGIAVQTIGANAISAISTVAITTPLVQVSGVAGGGGGTAVDVTMESGTAGSQGISVSATRPVALDANAAVIGVVSTPVQHAGDPFGSTAVAAFAAATPTRATGSGSYVVGMMFLGDFGGNPAYDFHAFAVQDKLRLGAFNVLGGTWDYVTALTPFLLSSSPAVPGSAPFLQAEDGDLAPVSSASTGSLRYSLSNNRWEQSLNGGAWTAFGGGGASSLQGAYDGAGSGAGRTISVFSAGTPVAITGAGSGVALVVTAGVISSPGAHDYTERFGANSVVGAEQATALGNTANASAILSLAVGSFSTASATYATALGPSASASVIRSTVVGGSASTGGTGDTVVVGALAYASNGGVAIGARAGSAGTDGLAIGTDATTSATTWSIALGTGATTTSSGAIAVGNAAVASGNDAVAIGRSAATSASETVAVGHGATATNLSSTAVGDTASGSANYSAVFGANSVATGSYGTAVGMTANAITTWATAIGSFSSAGDNAVALGVGASATGLQSTAIGTGATASQVSATALGRGTNAVHTSSVAIGEGATTSAANECVFAHNLYLLCRAQIWQSGANTIATFDAQADSAVLGASGSSLGFYGATPVGKPTITGSRGGNAALASLLTAGANLGLWTDSTTP